MGRRPASGKLLPPNAKSIKRAVKETIAARVVSEFRIEGQRGLVLLVTPAGTATWYLHYDFVKGGQRNRRKHKIGRLDAVGLGEAIQQADALRPAINRGADPVRQRQAMQEITTFGELAEDRFLRGEPFRQTTASDYRLVLKKDILPVIGNLAAEGGVTRQHVIDIMDGAVARGASRRADTARAVISSIYSHGIDRGLVTANPSVGIRRRHDYLPRAVVATADQIRLLWRALDDRTAAMDEAISEIVRLALLTGQRRSELAGSGTSDVVLEPGSERLVFRRERVKNGNAHLVPLSPQAIRVVTRAVNRAGHGVYLFPGSRPGTPVSPRSVSKAMERTRVRLGIPDVTFHDLRRTMGSYLARYGVPEHVRKKVLNHDGKRSGNVTADVYSWYGYDAEKRAAMELWGEAVEYMIEGGKGEIDAYEVRLARHKGNGTIRVF